MKKLITLILILSALTVSAQTYFSTTTSPFSSNSNLSHLGTLTLGSTYESIVDPWGTNKILELYKPTGTIYMKVGTNLGKLNIGVAGGNGNFSPIATPGDIVFQKQTAKNVIFNLNNSANDGNNAFFFGDSQNTRTLSILNNGRVGIGTGTPDSELSVNGTVHARKVLVDLVGWPDFVFAKNYQLPTLIEVEKHIKEEGHLQNIPDAKEVEENGVELGEMTSKLLQKIEELTLYTIEQQKLIEKLQKDLEELKKKS